MKQILNLGMAALCVASLSSCSSYYVSTLAGTNIKKNAQTGTFEMENDTLAISYNFSGENAPVKISVRNKLTVPLYVDWSRSSLIYKGEAIGYIPDSTGFSASYSSVTPNWQIRQYADGDINGKVGRPKDVSFIPPGSGIKSTVVFMNSPIFKALPDSVHNQPEYVRYGTHKVKVRARDFSKEDSPVTFRSYLTLFISKGDPDKSFAVDNEFYVARSVKRTSKPDDLTTSVGDTFYTVTKNKGGYVALGVITGGAFIWAASASLDKASLNMNGR